ncbi:MAG: helix-turn-helix transcriptional regulator [Treponema sp.]|jgi:transcriptional regulator with XRE-family HTH domain|nr:helix-turn-helix transcriptional regulator [Treponema sp.]
MTSIRKVLAANIKTYRNALGLSQSRLAEQVDTATHYIAMIEGGKNFPSAEMIERIAAALGKDSVDLFAITPMQQDWKEALLADIEKLIADRIFDLRNKPEQAQRENGLSEKPGGGHPGAPDLSLPRTHP